ncbi:unnamed protein product [Rotaria socialis]|uniref:Uncharacterized protein n=2 Tax=Rotaria socialis TaxID=392032 RepID=A0A821CHP6_9BILA|nr:unnamed protein product [Rotaria socialis]CAF4227021.1 unnamed protein product [Rotaria socialis]CAF4601884.1 unnamed protein product [Rotaria socialis]
MKGPWQLVPLSFRHLLKKRSVSTMHKMKTHIVHVLADGVGGINGFLIPTWNELTLQLHREYFKAHDSCQDSVELMRQTQKQGLFQLQAAPDDDKRLLSVLITNHAKKV